MNDDVSSPTAFAQRVQSLDERDRALLQAFVQVPGHRRTAADLQPIAGEEPELCLRLRRKGGRVRRRDRDMTWPDAAMTPLERASTASDRSLLSAPRSLTEPVSWRFSILSHTRAPEPPARAGENSTGVRRTRPRKSSAAAVTSWGKRTRRV